MSASRRPWMKWNPSDWRADQAVQSCSLAARGLWLEMLGLMHEAEPYGYLILNGQSIPTEQLARLVRADSAEVENLIAELESVGVFSRDRKGQIYSRRMIRDEKKAKIGKKYAKQRWGQDAETIGEKAAPNGVGHGEPGKTPMLRTKKEELREKKEPPLPPKEDGPNFDEWYAAYPRHVAPGAAEKAYRKARKIADTETLLAGIETYRRTKPDYADWKYPATWLNGKCWLDEAGISTSPNGSDEPYMEEYQEDLRRDYTRLKAWVERGYWDEFWGAKPGEDGCSIDPKVMAEHGSETL